MLPSLLHQQYTRKRFPTILDHGTEVTDTSATPVTATYKGSIQPGTGGTDLTNREGAEVVYTIFGFPGDDVHDRDVVSFDGHDYQVNGEPERWGTGVLDHIVIRLSRWAG